MFASLFLFIHFPPTLSSTVSVMGIAQSKQPASQSPQRAELVQPTEEGVYPPKESESSTRFVCISDTHNKHDQITIPEGDVLIHAGDFSDLGIDDEIVKFNTFLGTLPHEHKLIVTGNHDYHWKDEDEVNSWAVWMGWRPSRFKRLLYNGICLMYEEITINGLQIFGTSWSFSDPQKIYTKIKPGIDILITHKPPMGILDGNRAGGDLLVRKVIEVQPKAHIFGHIHESYGTQVVNNILFINASICNLKLEAAHAPIVFDVNLVL